MELDLNASPEKDWGAGGNYYGGLANQCGRGCPATVVGGGAKLGLGARASGVGVGALEPGRARPWIPFLSLGHAG